MQASSVGPEATSSKSLQDGLNRVETALAGTSLEVLAQAIGKDDSQVCKIRSGELGAKVRDVVKLLHAAGLKVVPTDRVCVKREKYEAMVTIAAAAMADPATARRLTYDE